MVVGTPSTSVTRLSPGGMTVAIPLTFVVIGLPCAGGLG